MPTWYQDGHEPTDAATLTPNPVLPAQFFDTRRWGADRLPEKRLMLAVLESAVAEFQRHARAGTRAGLRAFDETTAWIRSDDVEWPFSFVNICHALGLEPEAVRAGLDRWRDAERTRTDGGAIPARSPFRRVTGSWTTPSPSRRCA